MTLNQDFCPKLTASTTSPEPSQDIWQRLETLKTFFVVTAWGGYYFHPVYYVTMRNPGLMVRKHHLQLYIPTYDAKKLIQA